MRCAACGREFPEADMVEDGDERLCEECALSLHLTCSGCPECEAGHEDE